MNDKSKDRDEHRGQQVPHLGADHYEKSQLEARAREADSDSGNMNPAVSPMATEIGPTGVHPERAKAVSSGRNNGSRTVDSAPLAAR